MRKNDFFTKGLAATMAAAVAVSPLMAVPVFAVGKDSTDATNNTAVSADLKDSDIIDYSKKGSLTIHKYDITSARAAGDYEQGDHVANGQVNTEAESKLKDYAIEGVEFTYLRLGDIETYSNTEGGKTKVEVVYEIPTGLAPILGLAEADAYNMNATGVSEKCTNKGVLHYTSTQLHDALKAKLAEDTFGTTSVLTEFLHDFGTQDDATDGGNKNGAKSMPLTDKNGVTRADNLELGLYLLLETKVPEQVTDVVNPWFVSLPFTNLTPDSDGGTGSDGGDVWLYDMTVYPKNETGNPTLDKSVRNAYNSTTDVDDKNGIVKSGESYDYDEKTGKGNTVVYNLDNMNPNNASDKDDASYIANRGGYTADGVTAGKDGEGYSHDYEYRDTTTASAGDVLDYTLVSKLPHITSKSSFLSEYTFVDILSKGLTYNSDVKIAFYDNATDAAANNTRKAVKQWNLADKTYSQYVEVDFKEGNGTTDGSDRLTVAMTEDGLQALNGNGKDGKNIANQGPCSDGSYSDLYMVVYYTVTVNSDASLVLGDAGNPNDVVLTWKRTSDHYYNTLEDENFVYSYSIDLTKHFSDDNGDMSKVGFKLYNTTDAYYVQCEYDEQSGTYYVTGKTQNKEDATVLTPNGDGKFIVYGLEADVYGLTEITTDNGYTLLEDSIKVAITSTDRDIKASVAGTTGMDKDDIEAIIQYYGMRNTDLDVRNDKQKADYKALIKGVYNEDGQFVNAGYDEIKNMDSKTRPALETANGRTIGKTDMYVGDIEPAKATVDDVDAEMTADGDSLHATINLDVVNNKNFLLPQTGGYGTILFVVCGCAALAGGVVLITKKKKTSVK